MQPFFITLPQMRITSFKHKTKTMFCSHGVFLIKPKNHLSAMSIKHFAYTQFNFRCKVETHVTFSHQQTQQLVQFQTNVQKSQTRI